MPTRIHFQFLSEANLLPMRYVPIVSRTRLVPGTITPTLFATHAQSLLVHSFVRSFRFVSFRFVSFRSFVTVCSQSTRHIIEVGRPLVRSFVSFRFLFVVARLKRGSA